MKLQSKNNRTYLSFLKYRAYSNNTLFQCVFTSDQLFTLYQLLVISFSRVLYTHLILIHLRCILHTYSIAPRSWSLPPSMSAFPPSSVPSSSFVELAHKSREAVWFFICQTNFTLFIPRRKFFTVFRSPL